jgi:hypothetical protein
MACASAHSSFSQNIRDTLFEEVKSVLEPLIANLPNTHLSIEEEYNLYVVDAILSLKDETLEPVNKDQLYDLKINRLEQDWGLSLRAQVNHNFESQFFVQDEFDIQQTPMRMRVGLDWDLMKNGLLSNQNKIQQLKNEKEADWLRLDKQKNKERLFYRYNVLIYYFNLEKIKLLKERKSKIETQLQLLYRIYYVRDIMFEEVIAMKGQLEQVDVQLKNYLDYNAMMEATIGLDKFQSDINVYQLPVLDIDVNRLIRDSAHLNSVEKPLWLEQENDRLRNAPVNDISLRLQLYQNMGFADPNTPNQTYTSAGVVASVPIDMFYKGKIPDEIVNTEAMLRNQKAKYVDLNTATEIVNYYYEFNYKLKQYVEFLYKYMLYEEKLRVEQVDKEQFMDYYQPFRILKYHDQLNLIKLELIDLKQQLYLFLLQIYSKTNLKSIKEYLLPISSGQYFAKLPASRTIFMDDDDFQKFDPHFIEHYLRFNDFDYAILNGDNLQSNLHQYGGGATNNNAAINFIKTITWNKTKTNLEAYAGSVADELTKSGFAGVMLNLHSADVKNLGGIGLKDLTDKMVSFFIALKNQMPEAIIFLNIPATFPMQEIADLSSWTEKIILRTETEQDLQYVKALPETILPFDYLPICVSLDVSRFRDRLKLEAYINQITQDKRINDIVFKDFQAFLNMESNMLND